MAAAAFPFLQPIPPPRFLKLLAAGELATSALLLAPLVPNAVAGAALTGFSGALLAMYARTPALRKPGSIWPTSAGIGVSKDVWMLGIGVGLLVDGLPVAARPDDRERRERTRRLADGPGRRVGPRNLAISPDRVGRSQSSRCWRGR